MTFDESVKLELIKISLSVGMALIVLALGWFIGNRLAVHWAIRQRRRELELAAANQFYQLYGEFFALWKLWNYFRYEHGNEPLPETTRWDLLARASAAEGGVEAILVKLASERQLGEEDIATLGRFRQAYQTLREAIRDLQPVDWWYQDHPEYAAFKRLATQVASMLCTSDKQRAPTVAQASQALKRITSNEWENRWAVGEPADSDR
jgi:hypothetical protein